MKVNHAVTLGLYIGVILPICKNYAFFSYILIEFSLLYFLPEVDFYSMYLPWMHVPS